MVHSTHQSDDGDDTLWSTECLYDAARAKARRVVERAGLDGALWEKLEREIDVGNVEVLGFAKERFPTSCVQAYEQLCDHSGGVREARVVEEVRAVSTVFARNPRVVYRARPTLQRLRAAGQRLALLTKGDATVQRERIRTSGLADLFNLLWGLGDVDQRDREATLSGVFTQVSQYLCCGMAAHARASQPG